MFRISGTNVPRNKTIKKPKFILEFLKCLAICLVVSFFVSYRYILYRFEDAAEQSGDSIMTYVKNAVKQTANYHEAQGDVADLQKNYLEAALYIYAMTSGEYGAVYENGEKIMETPSGLYACIGVALPEHDETYEYFFLEDSSCLEPLAGYKDGKYDLKESWRLLNRYQEDWDMAERAMRWGLIPKIYAIRFKNVYINNETHRFLPGEIRIEDWNTGKVVDEFDCTPEDTTGYTYLPLGTNQFMSLYGYLDPAKTGQVSVYFYYELGDVVTIQPENSLAEWYFASRVTEPAIMSPFDLLPVTSRVTVFVGIVLAILLALIAAVIRYQRKRTIWEIFEYRKKTTEAMAHDLKTPLAAISAYAECLEESPAQAPEYSSKIRDNVSEMNQMLERILHFSRSEGGQVSGVRSSVDVGALVRETVGKYSALMEKNRVTTSLPGADEGTVVITTDEALLRQAIENLFSNCAKYAEPESEVEIRISEAELSFRNRTTMNDVDVENLKKPFVKGESSRGESGTGLGLAIADNNLKMLGYKLQLALQDGWFEAKVILK
ncbi:MAG: HAMP domain-containing histidine kinase [Clostridiales bacterium]|nr:HAMP domain-containing histidine kinase [Clostridiales bacterium]